MSTYTTMRNFTFLFFLFFCFSAQAQYFDAGVFVGTANYQGELIKTHMEPTEYNFACGAFLRYNLSPKLAAKLMVNGTKLTGSDVFSNNRSRNLSFTTFIAEVGVQGEFNLFDYNILDGAHKATPYVFLGGAGFYYNPQAEYKGTMVDLRPLGTEGQGLPGYEKQYSKFAVAIPLGLGVKVAIHEVSNIGFEIGMRKTFTDYIDDVSGNYPVMAELFESRGEIATQLSYRAHQYNRDLPRDPGTGLRGNPDTTDWYLFGGVTLSINLKGGNKSFGKYPPKRKSRSQRFHSQNPWYGF